MTGSLLTRTVFMKCANTLGWMSGRLDVLSRAICLACLLAMCVIVNLGVLARFVLNSPIAWVEELTTSLMVWAAVLGIAVALKSDEHISLVFIRQLLPKRVRLAVDIAVRSLIFLFVAFLAKEGTSLALFVAERQISPTLGVSMIWSYLALPIGSGIMLIHLASWAVELAQKTRTPDGGEQE